MRVEVSPQLLCYRRSYSNSEKFPCPHSPPPQLEAVSPLVMIEDTLRAFSAPLAHKLLEQRVVIDPRLPDFVMADPHR